MRLARISTADGPRQAAVSLDQTRFVPPGGARLPGLVDPPLTEARAFDEAALLAPVLPSKIIGIGRNYKAHAEELGNTVPDRPLMFLKASSSLLDPGAAIGLPTDSQRVEHEGELGVVIGVRCRHVAAADWRSVVAGFVAVNDVTARDLQRLDVQFTRGKSFDTFCPVGPWMETELDTRSLSVRVEVETGPAGQREVQVRQDGNTQLMMFDLPTLIAYVSRAMTLLPGDVIATGTPKGVGPLLDGDVVSVTVEGIGTLRNPVRTDPAGR